jgi:hypothetical protein
MFHGQSRIRDIDSLSSLDPSDLVAQEEFRCLDSQISTRASESGLCRHVHIKLILKQCEVGRC